MVRVISVHHFTKQDVAALDRVGGQGVARGNGDYIFIGGQHRIDIRDLKSGGTLKGNFPTVDLVQQLVYCKKGNYVCALESKPARHGGDHTYVRVYLNWESDVDNQPMKARIAGKVTPGSQSGLDALEMVEIPTRKPVQYIACCQTTGNIALVSGMSISIFKFFLKTHDMSKIKFVDFEEIIEIDNAFVISEVAIAEDIIGCISDTEAHVFQVVINAALLKSASEDIQGSSPSESLSSYGPKSKVRSLSRSPGRTSESSMAAFQGRKFVTKETGLYLARKADDYIDLSKLKWIPTLGYGRNHKKDDSKFILFPSLVGAAQCGTLTEPEEVLGPVCSSECSNVRIKLISGHGSSQRVATGIFDGITLLHRRINQVSEPDLPFSNLQLQCIYNKNKAGSPLSKNSTHPLLPMVGEKASKKMGVSIFITTPHIGYLYHATLAVNPLENCVDRGGIFSYTAPVDFIALEPCLLHALTLTGLETYTVRPHPYIIESHLDEEQLMFVPPHWEESVCLVGLRPFLNVESLTLTDSCLALIAANDEGGDKSHTAYSLHLPTASSLYKEMIRVGLGHKNASPTTYFHLLLEAHLVLITSIYYQLKQGEEPTENWEVVEKEDLLSLLQDSCSLLGDFYASCSSEFEWHQALQYYRSSTLSPDAVLERLPSDSPGLIHILTCLLQHPDTALLTPAQTNCILDALEKVAPEEVSMLVLTSPCLKDYKKDKVLNILKQEISKTSQPTPQDVFALALIILEKGSEQVSSVLALLQTDQLIEILVRNYRRLIDREEDKLKLSLFSQVLVEQKWDIFTETFVLLIGEGTLSLNAFVDAFVSVFPIVSCGIECNTNSLRLRDLIENFFLQYGYLVDSTYQKEKYGKAISVLVSLYMASLLGAFSSESEEERQRLERRSSSMPLFGDRLSFLNDFPPFHSKPPPPPAKCRRPSTPPAPIAGVAEKRSHDRQSSDGDDPQDDEVPGDAPCNCSICCVDLLHLQSLLCSGFPSYEDRSTVLKVVESNPDLRGSSSLHILCLDPSQQLTFLIERQPNALLQYCKDMYESPAEWEGVLVELINQVSGLQKEDTQRDLLETVLNEILGELVLTSSFDVFTQILPKTRHEEYRSQIRQCHSAGMALFLKDAFTTYADNVLTQVFNDAKP